MSKKDCMIMSLNEWVKRCDRGTDGSMVYDVLHDWKIEREKLQAKVKRMQKKKVQSDD